VTDALVGLTVLFPILTGLICLLFRSRKARGGMVYVTAAVLIVSGLFFLARGVGPIEYSPDAGWNSLITALNYAILVYFAFVAGRDILRRGASRHSVLSLVLAVAAAIPVAVFQFSGMSHGASGASPVLYICHFSMLRVVLVSFVGALICIYSLRYMRLHEEQQTRLGGLIGTRQPRFFFYMLIFMGAMNGVALSNNLLWLAFFWNLTMLCAYALIRHDETAQAITGAFRTLWICLIGGVCLSVTVILAWQGPLNTLSLVTLVEAGAVAYPMLLLPFALLCVAGFTRAAQPPFHRWGIRAALVTPAPARAMLYPFKTIGAFIILYLSPAFHGTHLAPFLAVFGATGAVAFALMAISQRRSESALVCSVISNLGLIILCAGIGTPLAMAAGVMLIIFLTISMVLLHLSTGAIEQKVGGADIDDMEGLARRQPVLAGITVTAMLSLLVAPFGILISKWAAIQAAPAIGTWSALVLVLLILSIGASTVFWAKWIGRILCERPAPTRASREPFVAQYHGILLVLVGLAVLFSLLIAPVFDAIVGPILVDAGYDPALAFITERWFLRTAGGVFAGWPVFIGVALALVLPLLTVRLRPETGRAAYMCGENVEMGSDEFIAVGDEKTELKTGGFYMEGVLGEQRLERLIVPAGVVLLSILIALVVI